jgi:hypothetical protein
MLFIKMPYNYTADTKKARAKIFKYLATELPKQGSKLEPVSYQVIKKFKPNSQEIYRVINMDIPFYHELKDMGKDVKFYATTMYGSMGRGSRIRKFAVITLENDKQYVLFQQSSDFSYVISVLDVEAKKRYRVHSMDQIKALIKIERAPLSELPLLMNDRITKNKQLKQMLYKRLGATY